MTAVIEVHVDDIHLPSQPPCMYCHRPVELVPTGSGWHWIHVGDAFPCRDRTGLRSATYFATPPGSRS